MSTARTGRRTPVAGIVALTLVVGISLASGVATVWQLTRPGDGPAAPAVHATLPVQEDDPGGPVPGDEDSGQEPEAVLPAAASRTSRTDDPSRLVKVRSDSLDLIVNGWVSRRFPFGGTSVTLAELDRYLPPDWLTIGDGTATLSAAVHLTRGTTLDVDGTDVRTLRLAGGADSADAAAIRASAGAVLTLTGVTVTSVDPATGQPVPATAAGRPTIVASSGGRLEGTDLTVRDLGISPVGGEGGRAAVTFNPGSTGFLTRTTVQGASSGIRLSRSGGVRLTDISVTDSIDEGLVLSGDRDTTLSGIRAERNGGNGVLVTGESSGRPITGIATSGNGEYGLSVKGQSGVHVTAVTTTGDRAGGLQLSQSSNVTVTDVTATDQRVGVFTHVGSNGITLDRVRTADSRWGVQVEKSTRDLHITDSSFEGSTVAGVMIGGKQITLDGVQARDSKTAVRIERGAGHIELTDLTVSGGRDGVVAKPGTTGIVVTGLIADSVEADGIRTASPGMQIVGGRITGGATGIKAEAATTIRDTTIGAAEAGIRSSSPDLVEATGVAIDVIGIGVNAAPASPFLLADSQVHALESVRGELDFAGTNDLSLPPLRVIGLIGIPLVLLAVVLEEVHSFRQRRFDQGRRRVPVLGLGSATSA